MIATAPLRHLGWAMLLASVAATTAHAQDRQQLQIPERIQIGAEGMEGDAYANEPAVVGETPPVPKKQKPDLLIVPIPQSSPALGAGITLAAVLFYNPNRSRSPWVTGVGGMYTTNKSWGAAAFHSMALAHDRIKVTALAGYADVNLNFYGIGPNAGDRNISAGIEDKGFLGLGQAEVKIAPNFYIGARYEYLKLDSQLRTRPPRFPDLDPPDLKSKISGLGPVLTYDSRDNSFAPHDGVYGTYSFLFNSKDLGSDFNYRKGTLALNGYVPLGTDTTLAVRGSVCGATSGGPFYDLCLYGSRNDLRGYETGRYRDRAMWATQFEVRQHLGGRMGAVFFGGIGGIAPDLGRLDETKFLPAGGMGLRYRASRQTGINLALDIAMGRDSTAIYFGIGEAF